MKPNGIGIAVDQNGSVYEGYFVDSELTQPFIRFNANGWSYCELCNIHDDKFQIRFY